MAVAQAVIWVKIFKEKLMFVDNILIRCKKVDARLLLR